MTYTIERLTHQNTWLPWMTGCSYRDAMFICFNTIQSFEMEVCRMIEEVPNAPVHP